MYLKFTTGWKYCLKNPQPDSVFAVLELFAPDPFVASGKLSPVLNFLKLLKLLGTLSVSSIPPKNALTFLLVASLELFLQRTSFLPKDEHSSDLLLEL